MRKEALLLLTMLVLSLLIIQPVKEWDEYVYELNGEYFAGSEVYFERIRPPILPIILSVFYTLNLECLTFLIPVVFLTSLLILLYSFSKDLLEEEKRFHPLLLLLTFPILLMYSEKLMTSLPAGVLCLLSVYLMKLYHDKGRFVFLIFSFFTAGLTTLTRYPLGLTYLIILILYFVFTESKNWIRLITSQAFFVIPILAWVSFIGIQPFRNALLWASHSSPFLHYFTNSPVIIGGCLLFLPFLVNYKFKKEDLWFLTPLVVLFIFFQSFPNKDNRYLIPTLPFFSILLSRVVKLEKKKFLLLITLFFLASLLFVNQYYNSFCNNEEGLMKLRDYFKNKQGIILSNFWPICSYYTNNTAYALLEPYEELSARIQDVNASYIIVSSIHPYLSYSTNGSEFANYSMNKLINTSCESISIYEVK